MLSVNLKRAKGTDYNVHNLGLIWNEDTEYQTIQWNINHWYDEILGAWRKDGRTKHTWELRKIG